MLELQSFAIDAQRGFLPSEDPLTQLPPGFEGWEDLAGRLPKLFASDQLRTLIEQLAIPDVTLLKTDAELERAMMLLSYLGHGYVWTQKPPPSSLPQALAIPWHAIAARLGRPPVLSYASYALHNWRRINPQRGIELGNIALLQNFLGGIDEEWFILVHIDIENKAGAALPLLLQGQKAATDGDSPLLLKILQSIAAILEPMYAVLERMPEHCDPYIYYNRVRPYINGWKQNPAIPNGLLYEGVTEYAGVPQQFRGETGAQSSLIPSLDAFLGVSQGEDPLKLHLNEMRTYMPPKHRSFIETLEQNSTVRAYVRNTMATTPELKVAYNSCVTWIERFRLKHLEYAANYIDKQKQTDPGNPTKFGTGGTPFMAYLKKHQKGTGEHLL